MVVSINGGFMGFPSRLVYNGKSIEVDDLGVPLVVIH